MKNKSDPGLRKALAAFAAAAFLLASLVHAQTVPSGYLTDSRGTVMRNANYLCWHTGYWSPAAAIAECDPDLVAKPPRAAASAPTPAREASVPATAPATLPAKAARSR